MSRPPRSPAERLFSRRTVLVSVLQGLTVLAVCVGVFLLARPGHAAEATRALTFATLVIAFLAVILVNRSWTRSFLAMLRVPNPSFGWVVGGTLALLSVVLFVPPAQRLFHFAALPVKELLLGTAAGAGCLLWFEVLKLLGRRPVAAPRPG
jgi:Ca2+-transporting ATPase